MDRLWWVGGDNYYQFSFNFHSPCFNSDIILFRDNNVLLANDEIVNLVDISHDAKIFTWKCLLNILMTNAVLDRRKVGRDGL